MSACCEACVRAGFTPAQSARYHGPVTAAERTTPSADATPMTVAPVVVGSQRAAPAQGEAEAGAGVTRRLADFVQPIESGLADGPSRFVLDPERARYVHERLRQLQLARQRAAVESQHYFVFGGVS